MKFNALSTAGQMYKKNFFNPTILADKGKKISVKSFTPCD